MNNHLLTEMSAIGLTSWRCPGINQVMPNMTRSFDGFHISYARHIAEYGCPTTALVLGGRVFFVLNGNHAGDLVDAAVRGGLQACIDVFVARIDQANRLSEHRAAVGAAADPFGLQPTVLQLIGQGGIDRITAAMGAASAPA